MGIRGILSFIREKNAGVYENIHITKLFNRFTHRKICICIDLNQFMFKFIYEYNKYNLNCNKQKFIEDKFINLLKKFKIFNIDIIFVMDGFAAHNKKKTIEKRKSKVSDAINQINKIDDKTSKIYINFKKKTTHIMYEDCDHMEKYFKKNNIKYIHNDHYEADVICKWLVEYGIADYCLSNDSDLVAYGCKHILMNFDYYKNTFTYINYEQMLKKINLSPSKFLDLCINCGSDFNSRFTSIKIIYTLFILQNKYNTLIDIISDIDIININYPNLFDEYIRCLSNPIDLNYVIVRNIFEYKIDKLSIMEYLKKGRIYKYM